MSKPWDNEPTPWTDAADDDIEPYMPIDRSRLMEQRMRAAERLLLTILDGPEIGEMYQVWEADAKKHLKAARKEDGR